MNFEDQTRGNMFARMKLPTPFIKPEPVQQVEQPPKRHHYSRKRSLYYFHRGFGWRVEKYKHKMRFKAKLLLLIIRFGNGE